MRGIEPERISRMLLMLKRAARVLWGRMLDNSVNSPSQIRLYQIGYHECWALMPETPDLGELVATEEPGVAARARA